jgi:release factor glutamine methyltransferase
MKLMDVLMMASEFLRSKHIENPRLNAELMLCHLLGINRMDLYLQFDRPLTGEERERYKILLRRRESDEPLQYILEETEFMSLRFRVSPLVLIPRSETETLVEKAMELLQGRTGVRVLDIGTGSGNIAVSLAKYISHAEVVASDLTSDILSMAQENAELNGVSDRISWVQSDLTANAFPEEVQPPFDVVVSNPPYISKAEWDDLPREIREFEPRKALCDEDDGLTFFHVIAQKGIQILKPGGLLLVETGDGQGDKVPSILTGAGFTSVTVYPDLNGIDRVVVGKRDTEMKTLRS